MRHYKSFLVPISLIWLVQLCSLEKNKSRHSVLGILETVAHSVLHSGHPERFCSRSRTQSGSTLRTPARGPPFPAHRCRERRGERHADWLHKPACSRLAAAPDTAIGQAAARSEPAAPRAPPGRLQLPAVAWGAAGGRGSVTALRRALGGCRRKWSRDRPGIGHHFRAPQSKRSLRLSAGGAGGERERNAPVFGEYPPLPQVTRWKEHWCTRCDFSSAKGPDARPVLACRLRLDRSWLGGAGAAVPGNREPGEAVPRGPPFPVGGAPVRRGYCKFRPSRHTLRICFRSGELPVPERASRPRGTAGVPGPSAITSVLPLCRLYSSQSPPAERAEGR